MDMTSGNAESARNEGRRVVVKLHDAAEVSYQDAVESTLLARSTELSSLWHQMTPMQPLSLDRLFKGLTPEQLLELQRRAAERHPSETVPDLTKYFVTQPPGGAETEKLAEGFGSVDVVEDVYPETRGVNPTVKPDDDPRSGFQGYLEPAPAGIDAKYAWTVKGGDGEGQHAIDLERGWTLNHEDLAAHGAQCLYGMLEDDSRWHGTSVLGVLCAVDNNTGCVGICPNISSINVVSYVPVGIADAIAYAAHKLTEGGVFGNTLILEVQGDDLLPVELDKAIFDVIKVATMAGVVVIEAAGNGGKNLDNVKDSRGRKVLNRGSSDFRESGAIMVGAATSGVPHKRFKDSNYGSRIDCFAWGENIYTTYSDSPSNTNGYYADFNRTSGATPIVTGAAVAIQGIATARLGHRFNPLEMRSLLTDNEVNTKSLNPSKDRIGVMPNLRGIIRKHFPQAVG
jgi:hypothetical protein